MALQTIDSVHSRAAQRPRAPTMSLAKTLLTVLGLAAAGSASPASRTRVLNLAPEYFNGTVRVENGSVPGNLDGFRMQTPAARSTSDFWYFDVFSAETNQTLNVVFFNSGDFQQYPHPLAVQVSGVFANGTDFYYEALADDGVTITNGPHGIKGDWKGIGSFKGSSLDKPDVSYSIRINSPDMGIKGTIKFYSVCSYDFRLEAPITMYFPHL